MPMLRIRPTVAAVSLAMAMSPCACGIALADAANIPEVEPAAPEQVPAAPEADLEIAPATQVDPADATGAEASESPADQDIPPAPANPTLQDDDPYPDDDSSQGAPCTTDIDAAAEQNAAPSEAPAADIQGDTEDQTAETGNNGPGESAEQGAQPADEPAENGSAADEPTADSPIEDEQAPADETQPVQPPASPAPENPVAASEKTVSGSPELVVSDPASATAAAPKSPTEPTVVAGEWRTENGVRYYYLDGEKVTGRQQIDGTWYYFNADGTLGSGRVTETDATGAVRQYLFNADGTLFTGEIEQDGRWFNYDASQQGALSVSSFVRLDGAYLAAGPKTVYYGPDGAMLYGEQEVNGSWYYLEPGSGARAESSFVYLDGAYLAAGPKTVYYGSDGAMVYGEQESGGSWYYLEPGSGALVRDSFVRLDGAYLAAGPKTVYYGSDGAMVYGEQESGGSWYYLEPGSGARAEDAFVCLDGAYLTNGPKLVYYAADGTMVYGDRTIDGVRYSFEPYSGALKTLNGIDVSSWDKGVDTAAIAGAFAIVKATQSTNYINPEMVSQLSGALSGGKLAGAYHFMTTDTDVTAQADMFLKAVDKYLGSITLWLDWEADAVALGPDAALEWLAYVKEKTGTTPGIYMSKSVANAYDWTAVAQAGYPLWGAQYASNNGIYGYLTAPSQSAGTWGAWGKLPAIHQYTAYGYLDGWNKGLDCNTLYVDSSYWNAWIRGE